jgi:arylsulfatase A-like enzyme
MNTIRGVRYEQDLEGLLHEHGYHVALVGKNHSHIPNDRFDYVRAYNHSSAPPRLRPDGSVVPDEFSAWLQWLRQNTFEEPTPFPVAEQYPARIVDESIAHLRERQRAAPGQPFFLWLSFPEPHNPHQVPAPYFDLFPPEQVPDQVAGTEYLEAKGFPWTWQRELLSRAVPGGDETWRRVRSNYCGMIRLIDDQLARFFAYLDETGLAETTHVVFLADHGDFAGDYGLERKGVGLSECLIRMPFLWRGPGVGARTEREALVSILDVLPTLCEVLDLPLPVGNQGRSLLPLLRGEPYSQEEFASMLVEVGFGGHAYTEEDAARLGHEAVGGYHPPRGPGQLPMVVALSSVTMSGRLKAVIEGDWKLIYNWEQPEQVELYHLASDPYELHNLAADPVATPEVRAAERRLRDQLLRWLVRTEDEAPPHGRREKRHPRNWAFAEGAVVVGE